MYNTGKSNLCSVMPQGMASGEGVQEGGANGIYDCLALGIWQKAIHYKSSYRLIKNKFKRKKKKVNLGKERTLRSKKSIPIPKFFGRFEK